MEMAIPTGYQLTKPFPVLLVLLPFPAANWDLVVLENPNVVKKVRNNNTQGLNLVVLAIPNSQLLFVTLFGMFLGLLCRFMNTKLK